MMRIARLSIVALGALAVSACFSSGKKVPPTLLTLTSSAAAPDSISRSTAQGQTITIEIPVIPKELSTTRVPAQVGPTAVAYVQDLQWVESPDRLFQRLVQETVMRTTNRVVIDPRVSGFDPGTRLSGTLSRFGYD